MLAALSLALSDFRADPVFFNGSALSRSDAIVLARLMALEANRPRRSSTFKRRARADVSLSHGANND